MVVTRTFLSSVALVGLSAVLAAQAPALDVKLGLWENTVVTNMGGVPAIDTSKMSKEQAAAIAGAMKGMAGDHTSTDKDCIKKEDLAKDDFLMPSDSGMTCTHTVTTNTKTAYAVDIACTGDNSMKGHVNVEASGGGTALTSTAKLTMTNQGRTMDMTVKMSGKYLGADCGTVK